MLHYYRGSEVQAFLGGLHRHGGRGSGSYYLPPGREESLAFGITRAGVRGWGGLCQDTLQPGESESLGSLLGICCHGSGGLVFSVGVCVVLF